MFKSEEAAVGCACAIMGGGILFMIVFVNNTTMYIVVTIVEIMLFSVVLYGCMCPPKEKSDNSDANPPASDKSREDSATSNDPEKSCIIVVA
uniref:Uncharacterized protein n=1 Tax=Marseillevirus LCMAC202 TaxID=2506606 RepID=A0A481YXP3_9VIRU|nr:MAG: hypothetical protein LCMAC202_03190 [Marseillevirus LCMAC202]